jgi:hypothetical protein
LLFVCNDTHIKVVEVKRYVNQEPFALMLTRWQVGRACVHGFAPCVDRGHAYDRVKHHRMSICAKMLVVLRSLWGHAMKLGLHYES